MRTALHNTRFAVKHVLAESYLHAKTKSVLLPVTNTFVIIIYQSLQFHAYQLTDKDQLR
jgi:hypothetical protein